MSISSTSFFPGPLTPAKKQTQMQASQQLPSVLSLQQSLYHYRTPMPTLITFRVFSPFNLSPTPGPLTLAKKQTKKLPMHPLRQAFTYDQTPIPMQTFGNSSSFNLPTYPPKFSSFTPCCFLTRIASNLCNALEDLVNSTLPPPQEAINSHLASNFAPLLDESPPTPCLHVHGTIPTCLDGVFLRNGPNPLHPPKAGYHYFDGDGMIHAVRIHNGQAVHACRFTRTNRYVQEKAAGQPLFTKALGELKGLQGIAKLLILILRHGFGLLNINQGFGSANAGLAYFDGKVLAISEDDMPYHIRLSSDGDIHTVGRFDFSRKLKSSMSAHPKVDPTTGELFAFSYNLLIPPYLKYFRACPNGEKSNDVTITMKEPTLVHDFAITQQYAIFYDHQIVFRLNNMLKGESPVVCDTNKAPRVGIIPKYDNTEANMRWFECPLSFGTCMHFLNAWEEGEEVVLLGCINQPLELIFKNLEKIECNLVKYRFNLKDGIAKSEEVSFANIDMGRINDQFLSKKVRYVYLSTFGPWPKYSGVCKIDLEAQRITRSQLESVEKQSMHYNEPCIVGRRMFGEGCYGSEPLFVPKSLDTTCGEDEGYILTFVHDEAHNYSQLLILDAQTPDLAIVASITMPTRVPYGFHSLFLNETQLQESINLF